MQRAETKSSITSRSGWGSLLASLLVGLCTLSCGPEPPQGPIPDEAFRAGRAAASLPVADEDWFAEMDGGVALTPAEVRGRNTWNVWTGGNQALWDHLANNSFGAFDLLKLLTSHPSLPFDRESRFAELGLWNEPGFRQATGPDPDRHGLWLDARTSQWRDPFENAEKYPGVGGEGDRGASLYGAPSGILGLRLFPNPAFDERAQRHWDPERYYSDPDYYLDRSLVRPYRVGMSCGFCHISASPTSPPVDPERPEYRNLSSTVGAQYFDTGSIFFYQPDPTNFVSQLFSAYPPGTLDTSLVATDNVFNPRTMNAIYQLGARLHAAQRGGRERLAGGGLLNEQLPDLGELKSFVAPDTVFTPHVLKDGADSVGALGALNRVYLNIGLSYEEWLRHFVPLIGGRAQTPISIADLRETSPYWNATEDRTRDVASFFLRASGPHRLAEAEGGPGSLPDATTLGRGREVFAEHCARCHSSKLPEPPEDLEWWSDAYRKWVASEEWLDRMKELVASEDFLDDNYLSTDRRIPASVLGVNLCSPMASNAVAGHIWDDFSSATYKDLPALETVDLPDPFDATRTHSFQPPGGGRGYVRVPSLVSIWSTAPFLLNNTLGEYVADPSVAGRLRSFEASMEQLLWPERREPYVARTTEKSYLKIGVGYLEPPLNSVVGIFSRLFGNGVIEIGPIPKGTPIQLLANIGLNDEATRRRLADVLPTVIKDLAKIKLLGLSDEEAAELLKTDVAPKLLELSTCPDFVMNRGHEFGSELSDADKRALIELLKTF